MKKLLKRLISFILSIILLLVVIVFVIPYIESVNKQNVEGSSDWMASLSDSLSLSQINIPGSHDSSTQYVNLPFFMRCQSFNYTNQLEKGVRYLDLRISSSQDTLILVHDFAHCTVNVLPFSQTLTVESILSDIYAFLKDHPTETILLNIKTESNDTNSHLISLLRELINKDSDYWYLGTYIPSLGDTRGKVIYGHRYEDSDGLNLNFSDQGGYSDTSLNISKTEYSDYNVYVQDRYNYNATEKWTAFTEGLKASSERVNPSTSLCINFLSTHGHSALGHPYYYAYKLNKQLLEYDIDTIGNFNIIVLDFVTSDLCYKVYSTNN